MIFLYNNLIDSATLAASSEASGYPAANLKNPLRAKVWTTAGATAGTAQLVIDHGAATAVTAIALTGYDWASAPGTLQIEFNATDSWASPSATETLTWVSATTPGGNKGTIIKTFDSKSYRYNRLSVVNSPSGTPTDWSLGRMFVGTYFEPSREYDWGWKEEVVDDSYMSAAIGGQRHIDEIERYRRITANALLLTQAQWVLWQAMINAVGIRKDIFVAYDYEGDAVERTIYGTFSQLPVPTRHFHGLTFDFQITESR